MLPSILISFLAFAIAAQTLPCENQPQDVYHIIQNAEPTFANPQSLETDQILPHLRWLAERGFEDSDFDNLNDFVNQLVWGLFTDTSGHNKAFLEPIKLLLFEVSKKRNRYDGLWIASVEHALRHLTPTSREILQIIEMIDRRQAGQPLPHTKGERTVYFLSTKEIIQFHSVRNFSLPEYMCPDGVCFALDYLKMKSLNLRFNAKGDKRDSNELLDMLRVATEQHQPEVFSGFYDYSDLHGFLIENESNYLELISSIQKSQAHRYTTSLKFLFDRSDPQVDSQIGTAFDQIAKKMDENGPMMAAYFWPVSSDDSTRQGHSIIFVGYRQDPQHKTKALIYLDTNRAGEVLELRTDSPFELNYDPVSYDYLVLMNLGPGKSGKSYVYQ